MKKIKVYVASHKRYVELWRAIEALGVDSGEFEVVSTWFRSPVIDPRATGALSELWHRIFSEIRASDMMFVKSVEEDRFRGVLVEIGAALMFGKPVYVVGAMGPIGDVANHDYVFQVDTFKAARGHFNVNVSGRVSWWWRRWLA